MVRSEKESLNDKHTEEGADYGVRMDGRRGWRGGGHV